MAPDSFASLLFLIRLRELDGARSLRPVAGAVLYQLLELDFGIFNSHDHSEILPHIIADLDLIDILVGRAHQCKFALDAFALLLHPRFQVLVLTTASSDRDGYGETHGHSPDHFLPLSFASFADLRCFATSSSSR